MEMQIQKEGIPEKINPGNLVEKLPGRKTKPRMLRSRK